MGFTVNPRIARPAIALLFTLFALFATLAMPLSAHAQDDSEKTVRVGWYNSTFNVMDQSGRKSGYAYEYQLKVASYAGWTYEYVEGSWSDLLQMLEKGEIDLMSDVSYTPEREGKMLFPDLPMGTEEYYIFTSPGHAGINPQDYTTLNGKNVGANKGSLQLGMYNEWAQRQGIQANVVELTSTEDESLRKLEHGELDAYVTVDSFTDPERAVPICKIGSSDFFLVVNKNRPDLLTDLNNAMSKIQDEDRFYNVEMFEKHFKSIGANAFLAPEETKWLSDHGAIRVGYQDDYLAFCASDKATGKLTGILKDYLESASKCMANARLDFVTKPYPTAHSALEALENGEVDCVFPMCLSTYEAERLDAILTPSVVSTDVYAVVRQAEQSVFTKKEHVVVAIDEGNPNYDGFLLDYFPSWRKVYYPNVDDCLKAVASGVADCVLVSSYTYNNISRQCNKNHLIAMSTGEGMGYCFAVHGGQTELYSILAKAVGQVPDSTVNAALSYYIAEDSKLTFMDFIADNLIVVIIVTTIVLLVILGLMVRSMRAEKKARKLISATETDVLTGLYNRDYFFQYADRIRGEHPDTPMDAIVLNIEQFHTVNALNGREFGDQVLRALGSEIQAIASENGGIAGRFQADRFDIYCRHTDEYSSIYDRLQGKLDGLSQNASIRLRMGVMPWQANLEPVAQFDQARTACSMARGRYAELLVVFDEKVREREMLDQRLLNDLRRALDSFEFEVHYQPKFNIQADPPQLEGAEALVRWRHPELGMIMPDEFIPLFERNGQISAVDKYIWAKVARQIAQWKEEYGVTIPVSVNLSRVDVFDPSLESTLDAILARNGVDRDAFKLEVTESAYTENADQVIMVVDGLRKKGYEVGMDDFGTGYSSLSMLSAMPVDVLKMDRTFIRNIEHDEKDIQLVALIVDIAKNLKIPVIAEGVEVEAQLELLKDLGCESVQGYYFSRPLHASDFEATYIRNGKPA